MSAGTVLPRAVLFCSLICKKQCTGSRAGVVPIDHNPACLCTAQRVVGRTLVVVPRSQTSISRVRDLGCTAVHASVLSDKQFSMCKHAQAHSHTHSYLSLSGSHFLPIIHAHYLILSFSILISPAHFHVVLYYIHHCTCVHTTYQQTYVITVCNHTG